MTKKSKKINLFSFSHNRNDSYEIAAKKIFKVVNSYTDQIEFNSFFLYFKKRYELPESVIKQSLRQYIVRSYLMRSGKFDPKLKINKIPVSIIRYSALIYGLFFSKLQKKYKNIDLIIDYITSTIEMYRWEKLINLFGANKVICVTRELNIKKEFPNYNFEIQKKFQNFNFFDLIKSIFNEVFFGIWIVLKVSIKTNTNLFPISLSIINSYLSSKSLFQNYKANFLIQEKHYNTEPVKNYIFKKYGGLVSTSIQKNIIALEPIFFYLDLDILFSLGNGGYRRAINYGGRIDLIQPVGSLFLERGWFDKSFKIKKKYDVAILGINTSNAYERLDSFNKFMEDHYSLYRWAAKLSIENPKLKIVVIHHSSAGEDKIHDEILSKSNVKVLDKNSNSYEIAFSSNCAVTYGSTMGYELNAHGLPTYFVDPGFRCIFLPRRGDSCIENMRISTYDSFKSVINSYISKDNKKFQIINSDEICLNSSNVSRNIYNFFQDINQNKI